MNDKVARPRLKKWWLFAVALPMTLVIGVAIGEWLGWPFLAAPIQRLLTSALERPINIVTNDYHDETKSRAFSLRFLGSVRLYVPQINIAAPTWSKQPHTIVARELSLELLYSDLWRAYQGQPLRVHALQASTVDGHLERLADGRATWQFRTAVPAVPGRVPIFGRLQIANGNVSYRDEPLSTNVNIHLSLVENEVLVGTPSTVVGAEHASRQPANGLHATAVGHYGEQTLNVELTTTGVMPWVVSEATAIVPLSVNASVGQAHITFDGGIEDPINLRGLNGHFSVNGTSLAAVGGPFGVTLPTTGAFRTVGVIVKLESVWNVLVDQVAIGASRLNGAFTYKQGDSVPLLSGWLGGDLLALADLGPAVGTSPATTTPSATTVPSAKRKGKNKVLPARPFDLAALRVMDADILIDIAKVDLNTRYLEPLRPLHAHLKLADGVLSLTDLNARTAEGSLRGDLRLHGEGTEALWVADLHWDDIRLERWVRQVRAKGLPPFLSGRLHGQTQVKGQGRSTAEILASLNGNAQMELRRGAVSHLVIEGAGLDVVQGLGVLLKGDDSLLISCAVADLAIEGGLVRPRTLVLDTSDTVIRMEGSISLADEAINVRAVVMPKDFSPLSLRTPWKVSGTFADPHVSLARGPLGIKLLTSLLFAQLAPLAALVSFIDPGDFEAAKYDVTQCENSKARQTIPNAYATTH